MFTDDPYFIGSLFFYGDLLRIHSHVGSHTTCSPYIEIGRLAEPTSIKFEFRFGEIDRIIIHPFARRIDPIRAERWINNVRRGSIPTVNIQGEWIVLYDLYGLIAHIKHYSAFRIRAIKPLDI